jgi:hypothetical protein
MRRPEAKARKRVLLAVLIAVTALWVQATLRTRSLEHSLESVAHAKMTDLRLHMNDYFPVGHEVTMSPKVTAAHEYLVFGATHGKVHIYMRAKSKQGMTRFGAFDYFFVRDHGRWVEKESGYCGDRESADEARAAFASAQ